ncbi:cytochrome P450 4V2-like [Ornithodoros turicata]|uniref:cytochrome P450 4V2-like n=1 Tax=Ornithodoros turicata TaxID=34597 RepID=UPI003139CA32
MLDTLGLDASVLRAIQDWTSVTLHALAVCAFGSLVWICGSRYRTFRRQVRMLRSVPDERINTIVSGISKVVAVLRHPLEPSTVMLEAFCGFTQLVSKEGIYQFWIGLQPFVVLHKAEMVEPLLIHPNNLTKTVEYHFLHPVLQQGLLTSSGPKWRERRKLITPAFHFRVLESSIGIFNKHAAIMVQKVQKSLREPSIDIVPLLTMCSLDIICGKYRHLRATSVETRCTTFFLTNLNVLALQNLQWESTWVHRTLLNTVTSRVCTRLFRGCMDRLSRPWLWWDLVYGLTNRSREFNSNAKEVNAFIKHVIRQRKKMLAEKKLSLNGENAQKSSRPFLDLLLDHHLEDPSFTEDDINEEVNTFMFAGHDTTAASTTYALFLLGLDAEAQSKVHEELDAIFGSDTKRPVSREDMASMKYMECVIKESQRLYSTVPLFGRMIEEDLTIAHHKIPRGTTCIIFAQMVHRDPEYYPNPDAFDPSRFLPENSKGRHPFAFVPFSAGPRNCLGQKFAMMEEKVLLATVLRHFSVKSLFGRDKLILVPQPIMHPRSTKGGVHLKFTKRH